MTVCGLIESVHNEGRGEHRRTITGPEMGDRRLRPSLKFDHPYLRAQFHSRRARLLQDSVRAGGGAMMRRHREETKMGRKEMNPSEGDTSDGEIRPSPPLTGLEESAREAKLSKCANCGRMIPTPIVIEGKPFCNSICLTQFRWKHARGLEGG